MTSGLLRDGVPEPNPELPRRPSPAQRRLGGRGVPYDPLGNPDWRMEGREMEEREKGCDGVEQAHKQGVSDRPRFGEIF